MAPSRLVDNFLKQLQADGLIRSSERILVALSGGSDSVALLYLLRAVAPSLQLTLVAAHLDHAMRPQSGDDVDFVRALCDRLNIPLFCERVDVPSLAAERKVGLEEAGRMARQAFLQKSAEQSGCTVIALGHHRGDQAETLLHHLG
ncbi:MAG: tRNA lysidine(34) synthetase TilS, partial [Desulfuromonadales bacterium]|nr:tRNA lysidine(34) synthetase TilS [Desulfuromonadales bacterium]